MLPTSNASIALFKDFMTGIYQIKTNDSKSNSPLPPFESDTLKSFILFVAVIQFGDQTHLGLMYELSPIEMFPPNESYCIFFAYAKRKTSFQSS